RMDPLWSSQIVTWKLPFSVTKMHGAEAESVAEAQRSLGTSPMIPSPSWYTTMSLGPTLPGTPFEKITRFTLIGVPVAVGAGRFVHCPLHEIPKATHVSP